MNEEYYVLFFAIALMVILITVITFSVVKIHEYTVFCAEKNYSKYSAISTNNISCCKKSDKINEFGKFVLDCEVFQRG